MVSRPDVPPETLARQFIDERAAQFHDAFAGPSHFNESTMMYEPDEAADLREAIEQQMTCEPCLAGLKVEDCSWELVKIELKKAQDAAETSKARSKKPLPKIWHAIGTSSNIVVPGLDAIPDGVRILRAGLAVIFRLAQHRNTVRQQILDVFEHIPDIIQMAERKMETLYQEDKHEENEQLSTRAKELQAVLVQTIPILIEKLNPSTFFRKVKSPFSGFHIGELLGAIQLRAASVHNYADTIRDAMIADTHRMATDIQRSSKDSKSDMEAIRLLMDEVVRGNNELRSMLKNDVFRILMELQKPHERGSVTSLSETLVDWNLSTPDKEGLRPSVSMKQFLDRLAVPPSAVFDDQQYVLWQQRSLEQSANSAVSYMVRHEQVQQLLRAHVPSVLLVEGCWDRSHSAHVSPISFVCATLAQTRLERHAGATLLFFCGRHLDDDDVLCGPAGLMRSLLEQLVIAMLIKGWVTPSETVALPCGENDALSIGDICELFHRFLKTLPPDVDILCIVDGISYFEGEQWSRDYALVMDILTNIHMDRSISAVFKLLVTTPTRSIRLHDLQPHQRVALRNNGRQGSVQTALRNVPW